eukprot:g55861.t1
MLVTSVKKRFRRNMNPALKEWHLTAKPFAADYRIPCKTFLHPRCDGVCDASLVMLKKSTETITLLYSIYLSSILLFLVCACIGNSFICNFEI